MNSKIKYKREFLDEWWERIEFKDWLKKVPYEPSLALCCYCQKNFSVGGQVIGQVFSHRRSLKHKQNVPSDNMSKQSTIKLKKLILLVSQEVVKKNYQNSESNCKLTLCYIKKVF